MFTDQACIGGAADIEDNAGNDFCSRESRKQQETESRKGKQKTLKSKIKIYEYCLIILASCKFLTQCGSRMNETTSHMNILSEAVIMVKI